MSFQAMAWAVDHKLPAMQKIILLMMANNYNEDRCICWPSYDRLADECGMNRSTVIRQVNKLTKLGLIEPIKAKTKANMHTVNRYRLNTYITGELKLERDKIKAAGFKRRGSDRISDEVNSSGSGTEPLLNEEANESGSGAETLPDVRKWQKATGVVAECILVVAESDPILLMDPIKDPVSLNTSSAVEKKPAKPKAKTKKTQAAPVKAKITQDWLPSERCLELISQAGIDKSFALSLVCAFILYWDEEGTKKAGWNATFLNHVKNRWERKPSQPVNGNNQPAKVNGHQSTKKPDFLNPPDYGEYEPSQARYDSMTTVTGERIQ